MNEPIKNYLLDKESDKVIETIGSAVANRFARDGGFCGQKAGEEFAYDIRKYLEDAGYCIVPKEPTGEMIVAAQQAFEQGKKWSDIIKALQEAAPGGQGSGPDAAQG